ncbi:MAG: hypothetical protein P8I27_05190 [Pirellulaceae bacterium]|nr:hypothetical protein [Pirellulaceae bacterium]
MRKKNQGMPGTDSGFDRSLNVTMIGLLEVIGIKESLKDQYLLV